MVKLLVLSDLHLESCAFEPEPDALAAADVVVLAGDIHPGDEGVRWARQTFSDKQIVYVAGNHEYYGGDWDSTLEIMRATAREHDVHFLENDAVAISGVRFLGCSLWTDFEFFGQHAVGKMMDYVNANFSEFRAIAAARNQESGNRLTAQMTLQRHRDSRAWLEVELPKGAPTHTVVVTHHYPHQNSTSPKFANDAMTTIFGSKLPKELLLQAGLWIHGHSHTSANYRLDGQFGGFDRYVRVICNPRGYSRG